jgi:hypothetical protein
VPEGVVDVLEPVEVDQQQGAAALAVLGIAQPFVEGTAHHRTIG